MKKQFKSSKKLLFEMVEKIEPGYEELRLNEDFKIMASYQGQAPEIIDTATTEEEANKLANEYRMAYKDDYTIWVAPLSNLNEEEQRPISQIAQEIYADWKNVSPYAAAYLEPMLSLNSIDDKYMFDSADSIIRYFLSNAGTWRGEKAKEIKMELKRMVGLKEGINLWEEQDSEEFVPHGSYTVSNSGGYEVMLNDAGDAARVRDAFGSDNPETSDWFEIEYIPNEEGESEPVIDPNGYNIPLSQVMKIQENDDKWMQGAVKKPGALHKELGIPEDETIPMSTINDKLADLRAKGRGEKKLSSKELKSLQRLNFAKNAKKSQNEAMDWDKVAADNEIKYRKMADDIKDKIDWIYNDEDWDSLESLHQLLRVGRNKIPIGVNENQMPSIGQKVEKIKAGVDFMFNEKNYNAIEAIYKIAMKLFNQNSSELNENK